MWFEGRGRNQYALGPLWLGELPFKSTKTLRWEQA